MYLPRSRVIIRHEEKRLRMRWTTVHIKPTENLRHNNFGRSAAIFYWNSKLQTIHISTACPSIIIYLVQGVLLLYIASIIDDGRPPQLKWSC